MDLYRLILMGGWKLQPLVAKSLGVFDFGSSSNYDAFKQNVQIIQSNHKSPLYFAPEGIHTSGKALIKFEAYPFSLSTRVQPVCINIERPFFDIAISSLSSSLLADVFFYMFSPLTSYKLTFLAALEKKNLSDEAFADIARQNIAVALKVEAVDLSVHDLVEWRKRRLVEQRRIRSQQAITNSADIPVLRGMALQVKEVLPHVPLEIIYRDLFRTRNVDNTITNILEGHVHFVPETVTSASQESVGASTSSAQTSVNKPSSSRIYSTFSSLNTAASSFSKSAQDRNKSFQERKEQLIVNARMRYIKKNNLDLVL